jgi:hypothetical protein
MPVLIIDSSTGEQAEKSVYKEVYSEGYVDGRKDAINDVIRYLVTNLSGFEEAASEVAAHYDKELRNDES